MGTLKEDVLTLDDVFEIVESPFESGNCQGKALAQEILTLDCFSKPSLCTWQFASENEELKKTIFNIWKKRVCTLSEKDIRDRIPGCYYEECILLFNTLNNIPDMTSYDEAVENNLQEQFPNAYQVFSAYRYSNGEIREIKSYDISENSKVQLQQHVLSISMRGTYYNEFLSAFITECEKQNVPYYINLGESKAEEHTYGYFNDNIQLVASDEMLPVYIQIIRKITSENPEFKNEASHPIEVFGLIDGWIGYYSDVCYDGDSVFSKLAYGLVNLFDARELQNKFIKKYYDVKDFGFNKDLSLPEYLAQIMTEKFLIDKGYYRTNHTFGEKRMKKRAEKNQHEKEVKAKFLKGIKELLTNIGVPEGNIDVSEPVSVFVEQCDYLQNGYCIKIELLDIINRLLNDTSLEEFKEILANKGYYRENPCFLEETVKRMNSKEMNSVPVTESSDINPILEEANFNLEEFDIKTSIDKIKTWEEIQESWMNNRVEVKETQQLNPTYTIQVFKSESPEDLRLFIHENDADLFSFVPVLKPYLNYYPITIEDLDAYSINPIYRNDLELPKSDLTIEVYETGDTKKYYLKDFTICETELQLIKIDSDQVQGVDVEVTQDIVELYSLYYNVKLVPKVGTPGIGETPKTLGLNFETNGSIKESSY